MSNLPYTATSVDLQTLFSDIAPVRTAFVVTEHGTGVSKGVGYVSFAIKEDAQSAFDKIAKEGINLVLEYNGRKTMHVHCIHKIDDPLTFTAQREKRCHKNGGAEPKASTASSFTPTLASRPSGDPYNSCIWTSFLN